jgi:secreted protein with Ig-like and vWFA domain
MKENLTDLTPMGDEALEARIIAWVLGEASAFEAAELEALCEQYPEWRVFERRMLALHECLQEVHAPVATDDWKLSAEKRCKLDEVIGKNEVTPQVQHKPKRHWWMNVAGIAAVFVVIVAGGSFTMGIFGTVGTSVVMTETPYNVNYNYSAQIPADEAPDVHSFGNRESRPLEQPRSIRTEGKAKPSAPSSASAKVIAAAPAAVDLIPVPAPAAKPASSTFGNGDDFGESWGGQDLAKGEKKANVVTEEQQSNGVAVLERATGADTLNTYSSSDLRAPADYTSGNSAVIAGTYMAGDADGRRKMLEEVDGASWQLAGEKGAAAAKPTAEAGGVSDLPVVDASKESVQFNTRSFQNSTTDAGLALMQKKMAEFQKSESGLAQRERITRGLTPQRPAETASATGAVLADDPIRGNEALTVEEDEKVAEVRSALNIAEGNFKLGKYEEAAREYEDVLRIDPYNKGARRGLERVSAAKSDYYRSAYDQTRAELLMEVDKSWELAKPGNDGKPVDPLMNELTPAPAMDAKKAQGEAPDEQAPVEKQKEAPLALTELSAEQEPYSTFSLRVSDNAFRIAQAAMAQGQRPAAESVRVEEFYNAFDYGDPVPTAQEPVAASIEQSAHPILPQRNLLRIGLRTAASGRGAGQPLHLTLLIDQSGSMSRSDRSGALHTAVRELSSLLQPQDHISVIGFSRTPRLLAEKIPGDQPQRLLDLLARTPSDGGTNLEEALKLGEIVAKRNELAGAQNRLLLLTDGAANLGNADPDRLAAWVKALRQKNIAFDIAGIGTDGLNDPLLVEIARHGNGRYYVINDAVQAKQQFAAQLAGAFRPAAENVKVQVQFNPKRVGKYQLVGFEKDRLNTEDFRNDKVDAAEMAAAEAGQALYQVELLPDGVGDIGEVSVRFRDVATRQMVERKWTIRHDATTPVFERAAPTMQLAGLAMLTAQKLQGGPVAPMIRFSEMPQAQQQIRDGFSQTPRVTELLEMIRQLND